MSFSVLSLSFLNFQPVRYGYRIDGQCPGNVEIEGDVRTLPKTIRHRSFAIKPIRPPAFHHGMSGTVYGLYDLHPEALGRLQCTSS